MYVVSGIRVSALAVCALLTAAAASAATLTEGSLPGGAFSGAWNSPTEVGAGFDIISGTGNQNQFDNFYFSALPSGSQTLSFDFTAPEGFGYSYSAGGEIYTSTSPFRWGWDGVRAPQSVSVNYYNPQQSFTLDLGDDFAGGSLYLAMYFTHGANLAYNIAAPSNAIAVPTAPNPAPIPLPAGVVLLGSAFAALGALGYRRRRAAA